MYLALFFAHYAHRYATFYTTPNSIAVPSLGEFERTLEAVANYLSRSLRLAPSPRSAYADWQAPPRRCKQFRIS